ncbi:baseplate multidomain protein megatron [Palleronia sp. KMU-117]|uniref:baseplate multidomain protein megatron n=1 Tax=Palleronia sp. KMU-117 TaxID=3434108 RepID=UPI003D74C903
MATIVLSAVGAAIGGAVGGSVLGIGSALIGRAIGATIGSVIDQQILGAGSQAIETGKVDRFRLTGAGEGIPVARLYGRTRISGQVIWASRFRESVSTTGGSGKGGAPGGLEITSYSYSVSLAIGLCEGEITRVGRIWADGIEISRNSLNLRVYPGSETQMPDPKIEAIQGAGKAPAYRGLAYVVIEDLGLGRFGNRVPQFSFEVTRADQGTDLEQPVDVTRAVRAVALMPGTGEYSLSTRRVYYRDALGRTRPANVNTPGRVPDLRASVDALSEELPNVGAASLIISWFGDDLRCGVCEIRPKVEQKEIDAYGLPWSVSGLTRERAQTVPYLEGRPVYGGTPTDLSVIQAIEELRGRTGAVMFYPFILMEQLAGNGRPDPWSDAADQPALPWRGRVTTSVAPGRPGSPDKTAAAAAEVAAFFGQAGVGDFRVTPEGVAYSGPAEFSYRRFILHYARLCAMAGGVDAFCIGSEMRGLTQIRDGDGGFPAVEALRALAADVREILGPDTRIGYAADWSEYFGYHPQDGSGDVFFHLDSLWADPAIDFVGIDNYMPVSDWREGYDHADAGWGDIHDIGYLQTNIAGGEGFDWYYADPEAADAQQRTPITDGAYGEDWVFRFKDLRGWWSNTHHNRPGGVRDENPTAWVPQSKPIWFTEIGCAAIDKGTNEPNKFLDPKSSESALPRFSNGRRDDLLQAQFLRASADFWTRPANNPVSEVYEAPMLDWSRAFVWAWDARPYPVFPTSLDVWSDGENYARGHWLNGRTTGRTLESVVREICRDAGIVDPDTSALFGFVRGFTSSDGASARALLQSLMLGYGFDAIERDGALVWRSRNGRETAEVDLTGLVDSPEVSGRLEEVRLPEAEVSGRVRLTFVEADADFEPRAVEAAFPEDDGTAISQSELKLVLTQAEGRAIAERWLTEARAARDRIRLALPPSRIGIGAGDLLRLGEAPDLYRVDAVETAAWQQLEAVRVERSAYVPGPEIGDIASPRPFVAPSPVLPVFLDLPLLSGDEVPHAPRLAVAADPWPGPVGIFSAIGEGGFALNGVIERAAIVGVTETPLFAAQAGSWDRGAPLRLRLSEGALSSAEPAAVLGGANVAAIGSDDGEDWEVFQFARAVLVAPEVYEVSLRLRGQAGTDALMPEEWPAGSRVVLLDEAVRQVDLPSSLRGVSRRYRIGPASLPLDDPDFIETDRSFAGVGLRPYAPVHLTASRGSDGGVRLSWIRRTRIDGDLWDGLDVPLGEASESYVVRILKAGQLLREVTVGAPIFTYSLAMQLADGADAPFEVGVAQISDRFGPGLFRRISVDD